MPKPKPPITEAEKLRQARREAAESERQHIDQRVQSLVRQLEAQGCQVTNRHEHFGVKTLEMPSGVFENSIRQSNLSVYFQPAQTSAEMSANIQGYLEFRDVKYAIWIDPDTTTGVQGVLGLNKTTL